ncbi:MAG: hypothetical protein EZS28_047418 [Streblomastix strix]|uniref:Uncharacterized protein n=1 Tax=Streblomastix strix TaxID=222440 RepID=A0A5J4THV1_9EUKA|nr:MAG: hypothetical protein EZS28_047418 [Streblomastix strix]
MSHVNIKKADKDELIDVAKKLHINVGWGHNKDVIQDQPSGYETRSRQSYPSIAQNLILDQVQAQAIVKQILDNQVGVGDPSLIDITNVNARIAAGQPGQYIPYPKTNYNALINQQSQNLGSNVLPLNQKEERELNIELGNEKEKEKELEKDQEFQTSSDPVQLSDDVLLDNQSIQPQQETESFLQYKLAEEQQQDLQLQQMLQENEAMNYKLGSMDWGRNSISKDPYSQKKVGMRYQEHNIPSYIQLNAPLTKAEKANKSKSKKNFIKEKEMDETIKAQKQLKKKKKKKSSK